MENSPKRLGDEPVIQGELSPSSSEVTRILIVDDTEPNLALLEGILAPKGYEIAKATNGKEAIERAKEFSPHIILLDVLMPVMDGFEACEKLKSDAETRLIPIVMLTALNSVEDKVRGLEAGADDFIMKPFQKVELLARVKSLVRVKGLFDELENAQNVLFSLALALDFNDQYTHGHSKRVSDYSFRLAVHLGLPPNEQEIIKNAGLLHDIGKIATDKGVLHKSGSLNGSEFSHIKEHPVVGEQICKPLKTAKPFLPIIRWHHEKFNGTGYPDGLVGEEIPLGARIMAIVDAYDALTSVRPYRSDIPATVAMEVMKAETGKGFWDSHILTAFDDMLIKDGEMNK